MARSPLTRRRMLGLLAGAPPLLWLAGCGGADDGAPSADAPAPAASQAQATGGYFRVTRSGDKLLLESNGLPNHATGAFPNAGCPFGIKATTHRFTVAASPVAAAKVTPINGWLFGVAVNGVVFDPTGPYLYDGTTKTSWHFEVTSTVARPHLGLDQNNAHSQPGGEYHYHGPPVGLFDQIVAVDRVTLVGYAADGFPIYGPYGSFGGAIRSVRSSYRLRDAARADAIPGGRCDGTFVQDFEFVEGLGDLDECNGRIGPTPEYPDGIYHYVLTSDFPFIPRSWRGTPDPSFGHPSPGPDAVPPALRGYRGT